MRGKKKKNFRGGRPAVRRLEGGEIQQRKDQGRIAALLNLKKVQGVFQVVTKGKKEKGAGKKGGETRNLRQAARKKKHSKEGKKGGGGGSRGPAPD